MVHADDEGAATLESVEACSDASLHGTYGFSFQGAILKPDGTHAAEFAGVGDETFDGHGRITRGRLIEVFGGQPGTLTFTGTYSVDADCTGTKTITINGRPSHYAVILVDHARAIQTAGTDPGRSWPSRKSASSVRYRRNAVPHRPRVLQEAAADNPASGDLLTVRRFQEAHMVLTITMDGFYGSADMYRATTADRVKIDTVHGTRENITDVVHQLCRPTGDC